MKILTETLAASETKGFSFQGDYLELLQADNPVTIKFRGASPGFAPAEMENVLSGMYERPAGGYSGFTVTNGAVAQTVKIFVGQGDGGSRRQPGIVTVSGVVDTRDGGTTYAGVFSASGAVAANTLDTIVSPGANVNGIIVHSSSQMSWDVANNAMVTLLAKISAPSAVMDGDVIDLIESVTYVSGYYYTLRKQSAAIRIPAGKGLYQYNANAQSSRYSNCVYTLL